MALLDLDVAAAENVAESIHEHLGVPAVAIKGNVAARDRVKPAIDAASAATGNLGQTNYSAAKGGITAPVKTAAKDLARYQTTVNAIRPGFIDSAMTRGCLPVQRQGLVHHRRTLGHEHAP